ncbi:MAG: gamma-glutamyltransferase, partial [Chloroflexia bacterium]
MASKPRSEDNDPSKESTDSAENITRRDFIKRTALTVGGIVAASALPSVADAATTPVVQVQPTTSLGAALPLMDLAYNPYTARGSVTSKRGVVATSTPLAIEAGLLMLKNGGNAVDAAIATAIAQTVVEPVSNGVGSDAFAMIWDR